MSSERGKPIRLNAKVVEIVQVLGEVLRNSLEFEFVEEECWTLEYIADWGIPYRTPAPDAPEWEHEQHAICHLRDEHEITAYIASGKFLAVYYHADSEREGGRDHGWIEARVRCEHSYWSDAGVSYWDIQVWLRDPHGTVVQHRLDCHLGYGASRDIFPITLGRMSGEPPKRFSFRPKEESGQAA